MTKEGIQKCIRLLTVTYPNTYKQFSEDEFKDLFQVWGIQFRNCDDITVWSALNQCLDREFPPSFGEIKSRLLSGERASDEELWALLLKAGRNGIYGSQEEWEKLPEDLRRIVTPGTIREIALAGNEDLRFIKRDIIREYRVYEEKRNETMMLGMSDRRLLPGDGK